MSTRRRLMAGATLLLFGCLLVVSISAWDAIVSVLDFVTDVEAVLSSRQGSRTLDPQSGLDATISPLAIPTELEWPAADVVVASPRPAASQIDASISSTTDAHIRAPAPKVFDSPVPAQVRCGLFERDGIYAKDPRINYGFQYVGMLINDWGMNLPGAFDAGDYDFSDAEMKSLADASEDGLWQEMYATRVRSAYLYELQRPDGPDESVLQSLFETYMDYSVKAIRNHSRLTAEHLYNVYAHYNVDDVEALAWLRIAQAMGGSRDRLRKLEDNARRYTEDEKKQAEARAEELIDEHALASGLGLPDECLDLGSG